MEAKKQLEGIPHKYVAGFVFTKDQLQVLLMTKKRPEWQKGMLNGIGGKVEKGETADEAMIREFGEETVYCPETRWERFATLVGRNEDGELFEVKFFRSFGIYAINIPRTDLHDEICELYDVDNLPSNVIPNLRYLIPMALIAGQEDKAERFRIFEDYNKL